MKDSEEVFNSIHELTKAYFERFGEWPAGGNMIDPEVHLKNLEEALKTGKKVTYPEAPPGVLI